jgi:hypothetical protein
LNLQRPTSNEEGIKMKKQTYDLEERLLEYSVRIIHDDKLNSYRSLLIRGFFQIWM